jgi:hypothetical protein
MQPVEAIIGKWVPDDPKGFTITFYRSGEFERSWPPEEGEGGASHTDCGSWKLQGWTLFITVDTSDAEPIQHRKWRWEIGIQGDKLTYRPASDPQKQIVLRRIPLEPGQSFDLLNPPSFVGSSERLQRTTVVLTLDTPLPAGTSVIWCASLALAWQEMEKTLHSGPVALEGAEDVSRALGSLPDIGLLPEDHYLAAGFVKDGILDRIRREMPARFPGAPILDLPAADPDHLLAYAYLQASVRYEFAFRDSEKPLPFKDSQGRVTPVKAFGIRKKDADQGKPTFRGQVSILFREGEEFAVDLSQNTRPYQIVVARLGRKATLRAALADLEERIARATLKKLDPNLSDGAILLVPNMTWRVEHRFRHLEGKRLRNPTLPPGSLLDWAFQVIEFKLDRHGATLASHADVLDWQDGAPEEHFLLDRPYLIVMRRRDLQTPFFVMWVDNAELLRPF